jgi:hypothetical protein
MAERVAVDHGDRTLAFVRSGAIAGLVSTVVFTAIHDALISDIWAMLVPMLVAGALSGMCVAWAYTVLVPHPSVGSWLRYNLVYLVLFVALAVVSIAVFEPIATIPELTAMGGSPGDLITQSMPLNLAAVVVGTVLVTSLFGGGRRAVGPVMLGVAVLVLFLGHNVSIIGLVEFGAGDLFLLAEFAGLIVAINAVFVAAFLVLERQRLGDPARPHPRVIGGSPW